MAIQEIKQKFGIIGSAPLLDRAIDIAKQVAPTDLTVLITGENGTGKEVFSHIIHQLSTRKHGTFIAVNCGAIPEGTIDSELFGHEKGSFTGAHEARKGYFEVSNDGTIFLDEVAELPQSTQARLLRILETGEFLKVGSSKVLKTNVRIVAATNVNIPNAIAKGKFREDLYYRLNSVPIIIPPLRERRGDIHLLFRKFAADCAAKYRMPVIKLTEDAVALLESYSWPGNIRQLKNIAEQISVIEEKREINYDILKIYIPSETANNLPATSGMAGKESEYTEREILYKLLFDMKRDMTDLKLLVADIIKNGTNLKDSDFIQSHAGTLTKLYSDVNESTDFNDRNSYNATIIQQPQTLKQPSNINAGNDILEPHIEVEESLSLEDKELEMIKKALEKHKGKRKNAAKELGISERTLYRKINEYNIDL